MKWIKAIAAAIAIVGIVVLPPFLLTTFVGSPVRGLLGPTSSLTDDDVIGLLSLVVWLLWAQTTACVLGEIISAIRAGRPAHVPGTAGIQRELARVLVGAVVALTITTPVLSAITPASAGETTPAAPSKNLEVTPPSTVSAGKPTVANRPARPTESFTLVEVQRGDTLWSLAETHLGEGDQWTEIAELNEGRRMADGTDFHGTGPIRPGWNVRVPAQPREQQAPNEYTVQSGDTLSAIAEETTGDAASWPDLFAASQKLRQPVPLVDPDLIYPGQHIAVPDRAAEDTTLEPHAAQPDRPEHPRQSPRVAEPSSAAGDVRESPRGEKLGEHETDNDERADFQSEDHAEDGSPGWMLPGFAGAGALLAGALTLSLRRRRADQHRFRRPGRMIATLPADLDHVDRSIARAGDQASSTIDAVHSALRQLADTVEHPPRLAAIELTDGVIALHLKAPCPVVPEPWSPTPDGEVWVAERDAFDAAGRPEAPDLWPLLVTIGHGPDDESWMLNLEGLNIQLAGDEVATSDFARFIAAEVACNPWSRHVNVDLVEMATETAPMSPDRFVVHEPAASALDDPIAHAAASIDRLNVRGDDLTTARALQDDPDPWFARMTMFTGEVRRTQQLVELISDHELNSASATVTTNAIADGFTVSIDRERRLHVPAANLDLTAVGLTADEANGCAALLAHADVLTDVPVADMEGNGAWTQLATSTGALRDTSTTARSERAAGAGSSILAREDDDYLAVAATTLDDLERLAPTVDDSVAAQVAAADPTLDADLEAWWGSTVRPRLQLLGPVTARTSGKALDRRRPYYTELFAYLATRPYGATTDETSDAIGISPSRVRIDINRLREWLGNDEISGGKFLPDARLAPSSEARGVGVYEIVGGLVDIDLFRRLRLRGESRGSRGIEDLSAALRLVAGRPFDRLRPGGWNWLFESDRLDQHMVFAVVDVAHIVVNESLARGEVETAREAAETAAQAAPDEETPRLDLVAVLDAEGSAEKSQRLVLDEIANRSDGSGTAPDLPNRSTEILERRGWPHRNAG